MIKSIKDKPGTLDIDLTGPDGNAYCLLAIANKLCRRLSYDKGHTNRILDEMMMTDYEGLISTFDREFGSIVTLWR